MKRIKPDHLNWCKINKTLNQPVEKVRIFSKQELIIVGLMILSAASFTIALITNVKGK